MEFFLGAVFSFFYILAGIFVTVLYLLSQTETVITDVINGILGGNGDTVIKNTLSKLLLAAFICILFWPIVLLNILRLYIVIKIKSARWKGYTVKITSGTNVGEEGKIEQFSDDTITTKREREDD